MQNRYDDYRLGNNFVKKNNNNKKRNGCFNYKEDIKRKK